MMRATACGAVLVVTACVGACSATPEGAAAAPTGGGGCAPTCGRETAPCPALGTEMTALETLAATERLAKSIGGGTPSWWGLITGLDIRRDGKPLQVPSRTVDAGGKPLDFYMSGWALKQSSGTYELQFSAGPQVSSATASCTPGGAATLAAIEPPKVDSPAAIAAAFPSDAATTRYGITFSPRTTSNRRIWVVKSGAGGQKNVDADTGAVVP